MTRLPTTDIYFRNACLGSIQPSWSLRRSAARPIRQIAPNGFVCGSAMLLIRRDSPAVMRAALNWRGRLVYLVDDDIAGAAESPGLPEDYRRRLAAFDREFHRDLVARADMLVVPSDQLAARFAQDPAIRAAIRRIEPCWLEPFADQVHFAGLERGEPLRIAHLGTGSHLGALAALAPAVIALLARHDPVEFTYIGASSPPGPLTAQPRARRVRPRRWPAYRGWLARQRFHLALYPLLPSAFDQARSANKLHEHAIVGAVGIYAETWQPGRDLAQAQPAAALLAPADPADWADALAASNSRRGELAAMARAASATLSHRHPRAMQQSLWSDILDIAIA